MRCPEDPRVTFSVTDDGLQHDFFTWQPPKGTMGISSFAAKFQAKPRTFWTKNGLLGAADALLACKCFKGGQSYWMGVASSFRTSSLAIKYGKSGYMKLIRQDDLRFFFFRTILDRQSVDVDPPKWRILLGRNHPHVLNELLLELSVKTTILLDHHQPRVDKYCLMLVRDCNCWLVDIRLSLHPNMKYRYPLETPVEYNCFVLDLFMEKRPFSGLLMLKGRIVNQLLAIQTATKRATINQLLYRKTN